MRNGKCAKMFMVPSVKRLQQSRLPRTEKKPNYTAWPPYPIFHLPLTTSGVDDEPCEACDRQEVAYNKRLPAGVAIRGGESPLLQPDTLRVAKHHAVN